MRKLGYELIIFALTLGLALMFGRKSKEDKACERSGMIIVQLSVGYCCLALALGIFMLVFVAFFAFVCYVEGGWEEAGDMMMVAVGISLFVTLLGVGLCIYQRKVRIMYNKDRVRICKMFGKTLEMSWWQLGHMVKRGGTWTGSTCKLYDRNGQLLIRIDSKWKNYDSFCQYAWQRIQADPDW